MSPKEIFDRDGVYIVREMLDWEVMADYQTCWHAHYNPNRTPRFNPVEVLANAKDFLDMPNDLRIRDVADSLLDPGGFDAARVYNFRFVVKDRHAMGATFLHQDCGYHVGAQFKVSAFLAMSTVCSENGGMTFYRGTHKWGYLGDVGEIDKSQFHKSMTDPICPALAPGDCVFMDSRLFHESAPRQVDIDRVMADIIYMRADDPANNIPKDQREKLFIRSRVSRIQELERELAVYKTVCDLSKKI